MNFNQKTRAKKKNVFQTLFHFSLFLMFLQSMYAWFTWQLNPIIIPAFSTLCCLIYYLEVKQLAFVLNFKMLLSTLVLLFAKLICTEVLSLTIIITIVLTFIPIVFTMLLRRSLKLDLLNYFTNAFSIILIPSLFIWILILAGVNLPALPSIAHPSWDQYVFENYFFCLRNNLLYDIRFCAIFLEPGHLGMICSFLLYANKFDVKRKPVLIILISLFLTLSLAAYLLLFISFSIYIAIYSKKRIAYFSIWISILLGGYLFFSTFNGGKNIVNELIIDRLAFDEAEGDIAGNNRFSEVMDDYFEYFIKSDLAWSGIGVEKYNRNDFGPNAGYKVFILQFGIIGTIAIFIFYLSLVLFNNSRFAFGFLIIYSFAFLQRAYPFWTCELLIFIVSIPFPLMLKDYEKSH